MNEFNIIPAGKKLPATTGSTMLAKNMNISFEQLDNRNYAFYSNPLGDVLLKIEEADRVFNNSECRGTDFDDTIDINEHIFYKAAAASGFLTGCMDSFGLTDSILKELKGWDERNKGWRKLVIAAAKVCGYKKSDFKEAVIYLLNRTGSGYIKRGIPDELALSPNASGLMFSVIIQFIEARISLDKSGKIGLYPLPDYYAVGKNDAQKVLYGVLYWIFHVTIKAARNTGRQLLQDIPEEYRELIEAFIELLISEGLPSSDIEYEMIFSDFLRTQFEESNVFQDEDDKDTRKYQNQVQSVILNEFITRGFYSAIMICQILRTEPVDSVEEMQSKYLQQIIPFNNRIVTRMCLISSGVFVSVNVIGATLKALKNVFVKDRKIFQSFVAEINIPGIIRLTYAIAEEASCWGRDIKVFFSRKNNKKYEAPNMDEIREEYNRVLGKIMLSAEHVQLLLSLANFATEADIHKTNNADEINQKTKWHRLWKQGLCNSFNVSEEELFINDEVDIYKKFLELDYSKEDKSWFYALTVKMALFKPYTPLNTDEDKAFSKLKRKYDYAIDQFARKQTIIKESTITDIRNDYERYKKIISGASFNKPAALGAMAVLTLASGGTALAFAPEIAVALVGGSFAGLNGAALTSASLAFLGGGSLAAGGFGMAGGTAVIAGGGALLGLTGSGAVSAFAAMGMSSTEAWDDNMVNILTYADAIYIEELSERKEVEDICSLFKKVIIVLDTEMTKLKQERCDLDRDTISTIKDNIKATEKAVKEMERMLRK